MTSTGLAPRSKVERHEGSAAVVGDGRREPLQRRLGREAREDRLPNTGAPVVRLRARPGFAVAVGEDKGVIGGEPEARRHRPRSSLSGPTSGADRATPVERALELKLLLDRREDLVRSRSEDQQRLRWHLHALWPEFEIPAGALDRIVWLDRVARKLARAERSACVRIARELVRAIRDRTRRAAELEREITALVAAQAPELLAVPGCGPLSATKLVAETAGVEWFGSDAKLARLAGVAPIPASSGKRDRHRLDRGGNRQLNCALHRIAVTQGRVHPPAREFLARKQAEGKSRMEALRCLKRHLARAVWQALRAARSRESINSLSLIDEVPKLRPAEGLALT